MRSTTTRRTRPPKNPVKLSRVRRSGSGPPVAMRYSGRYSKWKVSKRFQRPPQTNPSRSNASTTAGGMWLRRIGRPLRSVSAVCQ